MTARDDIVKLLEDHGQVIDPNISPLEQLLEFNHYCMRAYLDNIDDPVAVFNEITGRGAEIVEFDQEAAIIQTVKGTTTLQ